jgi:4-amino-4-deoxy-L-arabinose transferase-like glycosyltransferase
MEVKKILRRVTVEHITVAVLFIAVWVVIGRLTNEPVPKRCFVYAVLLPFALALAWHHTLPADRRMRIYSSVLAFFFALCCTWGYSLFKSFDLQMCWGTLSLFVLWVVKMGVYTYMFRSFILCIFSRLRRPGAGEGAPVFWNISDRLLFLLFFCCRIPYLIAYYPCLFDYDGAVSLSSFGEGRELYDHHPFLVTCLQKTFFEIGQFLGNPSLGMALLSLLFMVFASFILVYLVRVCGRIGAPVWTQKTLVVVYAVLPLFPLVSIYDTKDGFFTYFILLFVLSLLHLLTDYRREGHLDRRILMIHGVAALLLCLSRHQGIYFVVAQYVVCLLACWHSRKEWSSVYLPVMAAYFLVVHGFYPLIGVAPSSKHEMLGTLFQQSALCFIEYPAEVSVEEREAFEGVLKIRIDTLSPQAYDYHVTDAVKVHYRFKPVENWSVRNHFSQETEHKAISAYLRSWTTTFLRRPGTCALASLNLFNGFFYNTGGIFYIESWHDCPYLLPEYRFDRCDKFYGITNRLFNQLSRLPLLEFFFAKAYYTWLFIFGLAVVLYRRDAKGFTAFLPLFLSVALFLISPTATYRYSLPLVACAAVIIIYLKYQIYGGKQK